MAIAPRELTRYNIGYVLAGRSAPMAAKEGIKRLPRVSSFFWIGVVLVGIAAYAMHCGSGFMFDPGVTPEPHEAIYYLIVGVIMIVNGLIHSTPLFDDAVTSEPNQ
jgi:hypothetical protein